jgi:hypothetical protein
LFVCFFYHQNYLFHSLFHKDFTISQVKWLSIMYWQIITWKGRGPF